MYQSSIVISNSDFIVVDKAPMLVCQSSINTTPSLLEKISKEYPGESLHLLTRIDQPVSGLVLIGRSKDFIQHFHHLQQQGKTLKCYKAIVEGHWTHSTETFHHHLQKNTKHRKAFINEEGKGKAVETIISLEKKLERYSILNVRIRSGKFHQIRAHLAFLGHPIKGDVKYGARRKNKDRYILLHSSELIFDYKNTSFNIRSPLPEYDNLWKEAQFMS